MNLHRQDFTTVSAPVVLSGAVDAAAIRRRYEREALRGLNMFQRSARTVARERAEQAANFEISKKTSRLQQERVKLQQQLDQHWDRLLANDPEVLFATLSEAFEDNEAAAAVAGVQDGEVSVVVLTPNIDAIPERMPKITDAGNLSLQRVTKSMRNAFYALLVCGHVLVTVREVLAIAPSVTSVRIAVVRRTPPNAYGHEGIECLLAALFARDALQGIQWQDADSATIVNDASAELSIRQGAADGLRPLDLSDEPALSALLRAVDLEDLGVSTADEDADGIGSSAHASVGATPPQRRGSPGNSGGAPSPEAPPRWRPRPGWGTIRDYTFITNEHGGTDVRCRFVPDDGGEPVPLTYEDITVPGLGEYARGIMSGQGDLTIKVPAALVAEVEQTIFREINEMEAAQRREMYTLGNDLHEDCGWAWTSDYKLVKAVPGLIE